MEINNIEVIIPTEEHSFGSLKMELVLPFLYKPGVNYPQTDQDKDIPLSEKTLALLNELRDSVVEDMTNAS